MHTIPRKSYNAPHKNPSTSESPVSGVETGVEKGSLKAGSASDDRPTVFPATTEASSAATPLLPLRDRDEHMLLELFAQEGIEAIEEDIVLNLQIRCPEPYWEDDSLEFLRDYL